MKRNGKTPKARAGISLRRRILTVIVLCALLPSLLIGGYCLMSFTNKTKEMVAQNVLTASSVQARNIENFFNQRMVNLRVMSRLPSVQALAGKDLDRQTYGEWLDRSNEIFSIRKQEQEYLERVSLVNTDDVVISSSDESMIGRHSHLSDEIHRQLIGVPPALSGMVAGEQDGPEAGDVWAYYIAQPVVIDGVYRGYVALFMNTAYFQSMAADTSFFKTGAITILDGQGNIVSTGSSLLAGLKNIYEMRDSESFLQQLRQLEASGSAE